MVYQFLKQQAEIHSSTPLITQSSAQLKLIGLGCRYFGTLNKIFYNLLFPTIYIFPIKIWSWSLSKYGDFHSDKVETWDKKAIKDRIIRDIKNLFEKEDYYKLVRVGNFHNNNYIEHESNGEKNKTMSIKESLDEIKPCLKDIINNLKNNTISSQYMENSINNSN